MPVRTTRHLSGYMDIIDNDGKIIGFLRRCPVVIPHKECNRGVKHWELESHDPRIDHLHGLIYKTPKSAENAIRPNLEGSAQ